MTTYIIGYDIRHPKRLQSVHRTLLKYACPIEYSIFYFVGSDLEFRKCLLNILKIIDSSKDDLRCYPLPQRGLNERIGRPIFPDGILWTGLPVSRRV